MRDESFIRVVEKVLEHEIAKIKDPKLYFVLQKSPVKTDASAKIFPFIMPGEDKYYVQFAASPPGLTEFERQLRGSSETYLVLFRASNTVYFHSFNPKTLSQFENRVAEFYKQLLRNPGSGVAAEKK